MEATRTSMRHQRSIRWSFGAAIRLDEGTERGADGFVRKWIMLIPEGKYEHPDYGDLTINRTKLLRLKQHFDERVRHIDIALDVDHKASKEDSRATGWLEAVELRAAMEDHPAGLWGRVKWTPYGVRLLKDQEYRYFSIEFGKYTDAATGQEYEDVILGGALTNRPFMKEMPAIALAHKEGKNMDQDVVRLMGASSNKPSGPKMGRSSKAKDYDPSNVDDAIGFAADEEEGQEMADDEEMAEEYDDGTPADDEEDDGADDDEEDVPPSKGKPGKGKFAPRNFGRGGKKMSETLVMAEMREAYEQQQRELSELRFAQYQGGVKAILGKWRDGQTVTLSDQALVRSSVKNPLAGRIQPRRVQFALTPKAEAKILAFMEHTGYRLSEGRRNQFLDIVQTLLSDGMVELGRRGGSFDMEARRTVRGGTMRLTDAEAQEAELMTLAEQFAARDGKVLSDLVGDTALPYYEKAAAALRA